MFALNDRLWALSEACEDLVNVRVSSHRRLLVDVFSRNEVTVLIRGAGKEDGDEKQMASMDGRSPTGNVHAPIPIVYDLGDSSAQPPALTYGRFRRAGASG